MIASSFAQGVTQIGPVGSEPLGNLREGRLHARFHLLQATNVNMGVTILQHPGYQIPRLKHAILHILPRPALNTAIAEVLLQ